MLRCTVAKPGDGCLICTFVNFESKKLRTEDVKRTRISFKTYDKLTNPIIYFFFQAQFFLSFSLWLWRHTSSPTAIFRVIFFTSLQNELLINCNACLAVALWKVLLDIILFPIRFVTKNLLKTSDSYYLCLKAEDEHHIVQDNMTWDKAGTLKNIANELITWTDANSPLCRPLAGTASIPVLGHWTAACIWSPNQSCLHVPGWRCRWPLPSPVGPPAASAVCLTAGAPNLPPLHGWQHWQFQEFPTLSCLQSCYVRVLTLFIVQLGQVRKLSIGGCGAFEGWQIGRASCRERV